MLKPYIRNKRKIDKLLSEIEQVHYTYRVLKHILTNNLTDIVYNKQVRSNKEYKYLKEMGNNTRLVIIFDKDIDMDVSIYSSLTGEGVYVGRTRYIRLAEYDYSMTFHRCNVVMIDVNLTYTETRKQISDMLDYKRFKNYIVWG